MLSFDKTFQTYSTFIIVENTGLCTVAYIVRKIFSVPTVNNLNNFKTESLRTSSMCETFGVPGMSYWLCYCLSLYPAVEEGTPVHGNDEVERNLVLVEKVAYHQGLSPDAVSVMLEFAMSLRMGKTRINPSLLLCLMSYLLDNVSIIGHILQR